MHTYTLSEKQRTEIERIMATCLVSMLKMKKDMRRISPEQLDQFKRAESMYRSYIELFVSPGGLSSPLSKF